MKPLRRKAGAPLDDRLVALSDAADLAEGRLHQAVIDQARGVVSQAGARRSLSVDHTAVALAGATGSGKSSLFNVLARDAIAEVGVTRPTTSQAQAALWDPGGSGRLLDWLAIPHRHVIGGEDEPGTPGLVAGARDAGGERPSSPLRSTGQAQAADGTGVADPELSGLILLDLPDHDSIELSHRLEVDRLVAIVDLLVWVLDPQKYADAAVHERYLQPLARHRDVMVIVLNQVDRLPEQAVRRCLDDLRRLLAADGLGDVPVIGVSARTGEGLPELRDLLARQVSRRLAWASRLGADVAAAADALMAASTGTASATLGQRARPGTMPGQSVGPGTMSGQGVGPSAAAGQGPGMLGSRGGNAGTSALAEGRHSGLPAEHPRGGRGPRGVFVRGGEISLEAMVPPLTRALAEAAAVPLVVEAVAKAHRHRAVAATGWPVTRWLRRLRPDPLRRLRLGETAGWGDREDQSVVALSGTRSKRTSSPSPRSGSPGRSSPAGTPAIGVPASKMSGRKDLGSDVPATGMPGSRTPDAGSSAAGTRGWEASGAGAAAVGARGSASGAGVAAAGNGGVPDGEGVGVSGPVVGRTSLPVATAVQRSRMDTAVRDVGVAAAAEVPEPWASAVRHAARSRADELADALDRAVATTSIGASRRPRWWRAVGTLQWLVFATMVVGACWLFLVFLLDYLMLIRLPVPTLGKAPWPTVLLVGGAAVGVVIALLSRVAARLGGRRRARKAAKALRASVEQVGRDLVLGPVDEELTRYHEFVERIRLAQSA